MHSCVLGHDELPELSQYLSVELWGMGAVVGEVGAEVEVAVGAVGTGQTAICCHTNLETQCNVESHLPEIQASLFGVLFGVPQ